MNVDTSFIFFGGDLSSEDARKEKRLILWPDAPTDPSMDLYHQHNYWHGLTIANIKSDDYVELWWFAADLENENIKNLYLGYKEVLLGYVDYFNNKLAQIIPHESHVMARYEKGFIFDLPTHVKNKGIDQQVNAMVRHLCRDGIDVRARHQTVHLSPREMTCLKLMSQGHSMKEMARNLNISPRTIECYIHSLHEKSGFTLKTDLIKLYNDQLAGWLDKIRT